MSITGTPGRRPVRVGIAINDTSRGPPARPTRSCSRCSIASAPAKGHGSHLAASRRRSSCSTSRQRAISMKARSPGRRATTIRPARRPAMFQTADGYINIAALGRQLWKRFCEAIGCDGAARPSRITRRRRRARRTATALRRRMAEIIRATADATGSKRLNKAGVPCGPINTIDKVFADPQVQHLGIATPVDHPKYGPQKVVGQPIHLSRYPQPEKLNTRPRQANTLTRYLTPSGTTRPRSRRFALRERCRRRVYSKSGPPGAACDRSG